MSNGLESVTCEKCKLTFVSGWSNQEALAEKDRLFPGEEDFALVCDNCFKEVMDFMEPGLKRYEVKDEKQS